MNDRRNLYHIEHTWHSMESVGIVVPAYNPNISTLKTYLKSIQEALAPERLHVELDGGSSQFATTIQDTGATVNRATERRGKGAAVTAGFEKMDTDILAFVDADGSTSVESLSDVISAVCDDGVDLAVGSRRHPEANIVSHQTIIRRFLGDGFAWLANHLLDVRLYDYQCGAKAIKAAKWTQIRKYLFESGFAWDVELIAMAGALDLRVLEVPVTWEDHPNSTVSPIWTSLALFRTLLMTRHRSRRLQGSHLHELISNLQNKSDPVVERDI